MSRYGDNSSNAWAPVTVRRRRKKKATTTGGGNRPPKSMDENTTTFKTQKTNTTYRKQLMDARIARGWNQKQLAQKLNVTASDVQRWESGKAVPPGNLRGRLNSVLRVKLPPIKKVRNKAETKI